MRQDIIEKLWNHLTRGLSTEPDVVYLLVEVRKLLLEEYGSGLKPFSLWMHCCWAMHVDLDGSDTTAHFLKRIDSYILNTVSGFSPDKSFKSEDEHRLFNDLVFLESFKEELRNFLATKALPYDWCDDDQKWQNFLKLYSAVVQDGSLTVRNPELLKAVDKVVCTKSSVIPSMKHVPFAVRWEIYFKDSRVLIADLRNHTSPPHTSYSMTLSGEAKAKAA